MAPSQQTKLLISVMSALLFFIVAHPETFKVMRNVFGNWVCGPTGCPSLNGLVLHSVVFFLITWLLMNINKIERADGSDNSTDPTPTTSTDPTPTTSTPTTSTDPSGMNINGDGDGDGDDDDSGDTPTCNIQPFTGDDAGTYTTCDCKNGKTVVIMN